MAWDDEAPTTEELKSSSSWDSKPPTKEELEKTTSDYPGQGAVKKAAKYIQVPGRGMRALGVGAERLIEEPSQPAKALERASEATKPDYIPQRGEKLGAFAGSMLDPINIAAAEATGGGSLLSSAAGGALATGAQESLGELERKGTVSPKEVGTAAAGGAVGGSVIHGVVNAPGFFIDKFPELGKALANIPKRASIILQNHPEIIERYKGNAQEIVGHVKNVMDVANDIKKAADEYFGDALDKLGIKKTAEERTKFQPLPVSGKQVFRETAQGEGAISSNDIAGELGFLKKYGDVMNPKDRLKSLLHLRTSIDSHLEFPAGDVKATLPNEVQTGLAQLRPQVNQEIEKSVGGEVLRDADAVVSMAKKAYNSLQSHIQDKGKAEDYLRKVFSGEGGENREEIRNLLALEKISGRPVISSLFKSLTSEEFRKTLGATRFRSSFGGFSAYIVSRALAIPYSIGVALAGFSQSPNMMARALRVARVSEPFVSRLAFPATSGALTALKNRKINELYGEDIVNDQKNKDLLQ